VRVLVDDSGERATGVEYLDADGVLHAVRGETIVLAANAIQTPRLLLHSKSRHHPDGLSNDSGQVGRNMMTHVMEDFLTIGHVPGASTLEAAGCTLGIQDFYDTTKTGVPSSITFEPRAIGAFGAFSRFVAQDPAWAALGSADPQALRARFRGNVVVLTMMEDLPRAENRVRLDERLRDRHGLPVPVVEYEPHAFDVATSRFASQKARELLDAAGARDIVSVPARTARFHLMGTCRMGDDPRSSVVDRDGRSHRVHNLYVADAGLFVTSAGVNPSLTVQALARRVADHLRPS
jgi:choline dehydrogenase-like flavoprotein